jgi:hypothetical protein
MLVEIAGALKRTFPRRQDGSALVRSCWMPAFLTKRCTRLVSTPRQSADVQPLTGLYRRTSETINTNSNTTTMPACGATRRAFGFLTRSDAIHTGFSSISRCRPSLIARRSLQTQSSRPQVPEFAFAFE